MSNNINSANRLKGIGGALLGALAGGLLFFIFFLIGFHMYALSSLAGIIISYHGYVMFSERNGITGVIASFIFSLTVTVIVWFFCIELEFLEAFKTAYENHQMERIPSFRERIQAVFEYLGNPYSKIDRIVLLINVIFIVCGGIGILIYALKRKKTLQIIQARIAAKENSNQ